MAVGSVIIKLTANTYPIGVFASGAVGSATVIPETTVSVDGVSATGHVNDSLLIWGTIDTNQSPDWNPISEAQSPGWTNVSDSQTSGWADVNTSQTPNWGSVNDTGTPNWTQIAA
jgi:hypothetical protein